MNHGLGKIRANVYDIHFILDCYVQYYTITLKLWSILPFEALGNYLRGQKVKLALTQSYQNIKNKKVLIISSKYD